MKKNILFLALILTMLMSNLNMVRAADYQAQWTGQSEYLTMTEGEEQTVWVEFKNTGSADWRQTGQNAVHLGTAKNLDRASSFYDNTSWLTSNRIEMKQSVIHPGETARFEFKIKAPYNSGVYQEYFRLVAENVSWLNDVGLYWEWRVIGAAGYEDMCMSRDSVVQSSGCVVPEPWMYDSTWNGQSKYLTLAPGESREVWVEFVNDGVATWYQNGDFAVHLGTANPIDRNSNFVDTDWLSTNRLVLEQTSVKPGETGRFSFTVKAPTKTGVYYEYFRPVVENVSWLRDQGVYWMFEVANAANDDSSDDDAVSDSWAAKLIEQTGNPTFVVGEEAEEYLTVKYKNIGQTTWEKSGSNVVQLATSQPNDRNSGFMTSDWLNSHRIAMQESSVAPGEYATFKFRVSPGETVALGTHNEHFNLVANDNFWFSGVGVAWNMVLAGVSDAVVVTADGNFDVKDGVTGSVLATLSSGQKVNVKYAGGNYQITWPGGSKSTSNYVRLTGKNGAIMEVVSYNDIKSWNSSLNDNKFRDTIEVRYSTNTNQLWVINELPLEDYVAGVAETGNSSPTEFLKAMTIAERTYVIYHHNRGGRHPENYVDLYNSVNGNGDDQVYRGYGFEQRNDEVTEAAADTVGKVVTYNNNVVVTPYFSHADGRTRSYKEVWGSDVAWCVSVDDPYTAGMSLLGHGVGMSALGAQMFAEKEGKTYDWILKYYYTGIDISNYDTASERIRVGIYHL
ncbi:MAG: SpoIID/LytB domain-containing protein [Patescibacteria group bacterium]